MRPPIPWYSRKFAEELDYLPGPPPDFDENRVALLDMPGYVPPQPRGPAPPDRLATYAPYPRQACFHAAGVSAPRAPVPGRQPARQDDWRARPSWRCT